MNACPAYYVSAGRRNVKLHQQDLSPERPAQPFGPYSANDKRSRLVTVFATDERAASAILTHWKARIS